MLHNIVQIIAFQALFLLVYDLFLKRETFFNYNRIYLLLTSILSIVLPFIKLPKLKGIVTKDVVIQLPEVFVGAKIPTNDEILIAEQAGMFLEQPPTPIWLIILYTGIVFSSIYFVFKLSKLFLLKYRNPKRWHGNILLVKLIKSSAAFSFFNTIFLGECIPENERTIIYKHELIHVKEKHSMDLLFFEILKVLFWFNPMAYIYHSRIKELHEYIADAKSVKQNGKTEYYQSLLNQVFDTNKISFTNTFFKKSLIKKRITMLQKSKSKQLNLIKYALLIPLVFGMLIYTSTEVIAQEQKGIKNEVPQKQADRENIKPVLKQQEPKEVSFSLVDEVPTIKACENLSTNNERKDCFNNFINKHVNKNFNTSLAESLNLKGRQRIFVQLKIDTNGKVNNIVARSSHPKLEEEAIRVVNTLPQFIPGRQKGELVTVPYSLPIVFMVTDKKNNANSTTPEYKQFYDDVKKKLTETEEVPFSIVEKVPVHVSCASLSTNKDRKKCTENAINKHVNKNFNTNIADSLNLKGGRQRVFVQFKIDKEGNINAINSRASHPKLEEEAERVIKLLPKFVPGTQRGKPVDVHYSLPIVFQIVDSKKD